MSECCDRCDTIGNPYAYWAFNARPVFEGFYLNKDNPPRSGGAEGYISNPIIKQYWDIYNEDLDNAPDDAKWSLYLLKTKAKGIGYRGSSENKSRISSYNEWKVKCFPQIDIANGQQENIFAVNFDRSDNTNWSSLIDDRFIISSSPGGFTSPSLREDLNSYFYNPRVAGHRTWACYHDDVQKYVVMEGTMAKINAAFEAGVSDNVDAWFDNNYFTIFSTIDIDSQSVIRQSTMPFLGYANVPFDHDGDPLTPSEDTPAVYGYCQEYVSRANFTANPWYAVFSSYDDWGDVNDDGWVIVRHPIDNTLSYAGGHSSNTLDTEFAIVRASYHSYTYGENPEKAPWVIARRKSDSTWVTGLWDTAVTVPNPDPEIPGNIGTATLHGDDVMHELTSGVMSENAILICYNRVRQRDLAIWIDPGVQSTNWSAIPTGRPYVTVSPGVDVYAEYYYDQYLYVYDSDRNPKFYAQEFNRIFVYPTNTAYPPDECNINDEEDTGVPFGSVGIELAGGYPPTRHKYYFRSNELQQVPTFITCDKDNMVYMGCPNFIYKSGRFANPWTGPVSEEDSIFTGNADSWFLHFKAYYRREPFTVPSSCAGPGGFTSMAPEQEKYKRTIGTQGINYGSINSREFAILPTIKGIHIRGCEGCPEMATTNDFNSTEFYRPDIWLSEGSRSFWLSDWIFSFDAKERVPCIEEAYLGPRILASEQQWTDTQYEGPESLGDFSFWGNGFAVPPTTYKFKDYFKYVNDNDLQITSQKYEVDYFDSNRSYKYYVSRRYYDELLHDYFIFAPFQSIKSSTTFFSDNGQLGAVACPYWEPPTNRPETVFGGNLQTTVPFMESPFLLLDAFIKNGESGGRNSLPGVCYGLRFANTSRRDKGWRLDYPFAAPDEKVSLWDGVGASPRVSSVQDIISFSTCWIRSVQENNDSNEVPFPYRGILLDVVDVEETNT